MSIELFTVFQGDSFVYPGTQDDLFYFYKPHPQQAENAVILEWYLDRRLANERASLARAYFTSGTQDVMEGLPSENG